MDLVLESHEEGVWTVWEVSGELDLSTAPDLKRQVTSAIDEGRTRVAVDLREVPFMDSSALGVLVGCLKHAREREGDVVLVGIDGSPLKVLTLTGLDRVFTLVPTLGDLPPA